MSVHSWLLTCSARCNGPSRYHYTKAYLASNDDMALLVFCGTQPLNLKNLITDLQASLIPAGELGTLSMRTARNATQRAHQRWWCPGHVHAGFLSALGINPLERASAAKAQAMAEELGTSYLSGRLNAHTHNRTRTTRTTRTHRTHNRTHVRR